MNRKKIRRFFCVLLASFLLGGCGQADFDSLVEDVESAVEGIEHSADASDMKERLDDALKKIGKAADELSPDEEEEAKDESEQIPAVIEGEDDGYAFSCLMDEERIVYLEILHAIQNFRQEEVVSTCDPDVIDKVFRCVLMDHPEIFYCNKYQYTQVMQGEETVKIKFTGDYLYDPDEVEERRDKICAVSQEIVRSVPSNDGDYGKAKYLYEYIIRHTDYVENAKDNQNICSVFLHGKSVCQGYAKAYQYLLTQVGIRATMVSGTVNKGSGGHAWVLAMLDGDYYYIDPTWGDASYLSGDGSKIEGNMAPQINYDYLCVTTALLEKTHTIDESVVEMPLCESEKDNYYVRQGAYMESVNEKKLNELFAGIEENDEKMVALRAADEQVYDQLVEKLIEHKEIFSLINAESSKVCYSQNEEQLTLTFWLNSEGN